MLFKVMENTEDMPWKKEKEMALLCGQFLVDKGYEVAEEEYAISFKKDNKDIRVVFERYDNWVDIVIVFCEDRSRYDIANISFIRDGVISNPREVINSIIVLMDYIENNYDKITDYKYCKDSDLLIEKYVKDNKDKFGLNIP